MSTLRSLIIFCCIAVLLLLSFVSTNAGSVFIVERLTKSVPALSMELTQGSLLGNNLWQEITWQSQDVTFTATNVSYQLNLSCMSDLSLCVKQLSFANLHINVPQDTDLEILQEIKQQPVAINGSEPSAQQDSDNSVKQAVLAQLQRVMSKLRIEVEELYIDELSLHVESQFNLEAKQITSKAGFSPEHVRLENTYVHQVKYTPASITQSNLEDQQSTVATLDIDYVHTWHEAFLTWYQAQRFRFTMPIALSWQGLEIASLYRTDQLLVEQLSMSGEFHDKQLQLSDFSATTTQGRLQGEGQLSLTDTLPFALTLASADFKINDSISLPISLSLNGNMTKLDAELNTSAVIESQFKFKLRPLLSSLPFAASVNIKHWQKQGAEIDNLVANVVGDLTSVDINAQAMLVLPQLPKLKVSAIANSNFKKLNIAALKFSDSRLKKTSEKLLAVAGVLTSSRIALDGKLAIADLNQFYLALNSETKNSIENLRGEVSGNIRIAGNIVAPQVDYKLLASDVSVAKLSAEKLSVNGHFQWQGAAIIAADVQVNSVVMEDTAVEEIDLAISTLNSNRQLNNKANYALKLAVIDNYKLQLDMLAELTDSQLKLNLQQGQLETLTQQWLLQHQPQITYLFSKQRLTVSEHCWAYETSSVCAGIKYKQQLHSLDFQLSALPVQYSLVEVSQLKAIGTLAGEGNLEFDFNNVISLSSQFQFTDSEISLIANDKQAVAEFEQVQLSLGFIDDKVKTAFIAKSLDFGDINLDLQIAEVLTNNTLQGKLAIDAIQLDFLMPLFESVSRLSGTISGESRITGKLAKPLFDGKFQIANAAINSNQYAVGVDNFHSELIVKSQQIELTSRFNSGRGEGTLSGQIAWHDEFSYQLDLQGDGFEFNDSKGVKFKYQSDLKFVGSWSALFITGEVKIPYARIAVKSLPSSAIRVSRDAYIIDAKKVPLERYNVSMQILVKLMDDVKIDSFGLQTDVAGEVQIKQEPDSELQALGSLQLSNGRYRSFGQDLNVRQGEITFTGIIDNPYLHIEAVRNLNNTADDVTVGIRLLGFADDPALTLFSEPQLTRPEMTSYLLRGRNIDSQDSDNQDTALTSLLVAVSLSQGENLFTVLGKKVGVRDLAVETSGQGDDTLVEISGYVLPGVQIRYGVGLFSALTEVTVKYEFLPRLYAEFSSGLNNAVDLYYKFTR